MSSLAIFGDSYAQTGSDVFGKLNDITDSEQNSQIRKLRKQLRFWGNMLDYDISIFGQGGTDLLWSYAQFLEHHSNYDKIIFVITQVSRITVNKSYNIKDFDDRLSTCGYIEAEHKENNATELELKDFYNALKLYHLHVAGRYTNRDVLMAASILHSIRSIRPDVKFIKAFDIEYSDKQAYHNNKIQIPNVDCLHNIHKYENKLFGKQTKDMIDGRVAHLTKESHNILVNLMSKWLETDNTWFNFDIKDFSNISPDPTEYFIHKDRLTHYFLQQQDIGKVQWQTI